MKVFKFIYIGLSILWIILTLTVFPLVGEGAIFTTIVTTILSAPVGLLVMLIYSHFSFELYGELVTLSYILISLVLGYYQWKFFMIYFNRKS